MKRTTEQIKQQYDKLHKILLIGRQRYLAAGDDPRSCPSGRNGDDYLTAEERQEALELGRKIFNVDTKNS